MPEIESPPALTRRRWLPWVLGSILIVTVPPLILYALGINRDGEASKSEQGGIHMRAFGIFSAHNEVRIEQAPPAKSEPAK